MAEALTRKQTVAVLFGGRSGEHEVSLMSARSVLAVIDRERYDVIQIGITHTGAWLTGEQAIDAFEQNRLDGLLPALIFPDPSRPGVFVLRGEQLIRLCHVDVFFPVLHGTYGEDGTIQGLFEMADVAYVGAGVLGSSVGMDKGLFKDVMRARGIPVVDSLVLTRGQIQNELEGSVRQIEEAYGYPVFVKPANLGSSVGITKCRSRSDIAEGLMEAAQYDRRILVERAVPHAREIEISVLGNESAQASIAGEIVPGADFYSYEAKYELDTSQLVMPASLSPEQAETIQNLALRAYAACDCAGMARVDFLLNAESGEIFLNEINTIPGFTKISMYPKLWDKAGLAYPALVQRLIELALARKAQRDQTVREFRRHA